MIKRLFCIVFSFIFFTGFLVGCTGIDPETEKLLIREPESIKLNDEKSKQLDDRVAEGKLTAYMETAIKGYNRLVVLMVGNTLTKPKYNECVEGLIPLEAELAAYQVSSQEWRVIEPVLAICSGLTYFYYDESKGTKDFYYIDVAPGYAAQLRSDLEILLQQYFEVTYPNDLSAWQRYGILKAG